MDLVWVMFIFFIFVTIVFVVVALMFPEWIGITGSKALEIQKHQQGDETLSNSALEDSISGTKKETK